MKIRAFISEGLALWRYLTTVEPVGVLDVAYFTGTTSSVVIVTAVDEFDFSELSSVPGVTELPAAPLDTPYAELRQSAKTAFAAAYESSFGVELDDSGIEDYEDLLCAAVRAVGQATPISGTVRDSVFRTPERLYDGDRVLFALAPLGLSLGIEYRVVNATQTEFQVSAVRGGPSLVVANGEYTAVRRRHHFRFDPASRPREFRDAFG